MKYYDHVCIFVFAENGGAAEGVRGHNTEHGEGSGGEDYGVGEESPPIPSRSLLFPRRSSPNAPPPEEYARFQGLLFFSFPFHLNKYSELGSNQSFALELRIVRGDSPQVPCFRR